jgi:hypothetical protein
VLLFGCRTSQVMGSTDCGGYREPMGTAWGYRTLTHKYVIYEDGYVQVFDMLADPLERTNLAVSPANAGLVAQLAGELAMARGDAMGISGRVTNRDGVVLGGIQVSIRPVGGAWSTPVTTHPNGRYSFLTLPAGSYQVRFDDPSGAYRRQYYNQVGTAGGATAVSTYSNQVDGVLRPV